MRLFLVRANRDIVFEIKEHIGVIENFPTGWTKEINMVSWNGAPAKVDIRDWDKDHERMSRGVTLTEENMGKIMEMMKNRAEKKMERSLEQPKKKNKNRDLER